MDKILDVSGLVKSYGNVNAVKGIDFYVEKGKLFAFLGPNGAGKSTTIDILCTLLKPDGGTVALNGLTLGKQDAQIRSQIGVVFQDNMLDPLLTVRENLLIRGQFYGLSAAPLREAAGRALTSAGASDFADRRYGQLSGGQRRRADIARALVNTPVILFLDEPTTGLDPQTRQNIWAAVRALQKQSGMTVFMTTHYMEEAAGADYVLVIDHGEIAARGTPNELREKYSQDVLRLRAHAVSDLTAQLDTMGLSYEVKADTVEIRLSNTLEAIDILNACRALVRNIEVLNGTMDDAFLGITGREMRE